MDVEYYYSRNGERFGPVPAEKLKELAVAGQLTPGDLVWKEGLANWIQAGRVKGLFPTDVVAAVEPPLPPSVPTAAPSSAATSGGPPRSSEAADAAREFGRQAKDAAVAAGADAWKAVTTMARNPVAGLREAFELLGPQRAMAVGIVFALVFVMCAVLGLRIFIGHLSSPIQMPNGFETHSFSIGFWGYVKMALLATVVIGASIGGFAVVRAIFKGGGGFQADIFLAGASLLPAALAYLLFAILGPGNDWIAPLPLVFGLTTTVLMTYSGCTKLQGAPDAAATLAVPLMLLANLYALEIVAKLFSAPSFV